MNKTSYHHDWSKGCYMVRTLSRSFDTLEEAKKFAEGKDMVDIYKSKGRYKVEWLKEVVLDDRKDNEH